MDLDITIADSEWDAEPTLVDLIARLDSADMIAADDAEVVIDEEAA